MDDEARKRLDELAETFLWENNVDPEECGQGRGGSPYSWFGWPGWPTLLEALLEEAHSTFGEYDWTIKSYVIEEGHAPFVIDQVKEKFGGLRFYITYADYVDDSNRQRFWGAIRLAERLSFRLCQECERPGRPRNELGWVRTLCDDHFEEAKEEMVKGLKALGVD